MKKKIEEYLADRAGIDDDDAMDINAVGEKGRGKGNSGRPQTMCLAAGGKRSRRVLPQRKMRRSRPKMAQIILRPWPWQRLPLRRRRRPRELKGKALQEASAWSRHRRPRAESEPLRGRHSTRGLPRVR